MSHEHAAPDDELNAIEAAIRSLVPARSRMDRDFVMFQAGRAAARSPARSRRAWIATAASFGLIALGEAVLLANRPSTPRIVERVVVVHEPVATPAVELAAPTSLPASPASGPGSARASLAFETSAYERLTDQVLRYGLDGLPAPKRALADAAPRPAEARQLLQSELRRIADPGETL
jgi:hypothetical protein